MKKLIFSLAILVMVTSLTAQVSVWDGSYEEFDTSNEKGLTEDNPILIENAAQLACMSQRAYDPNNCKYYRLTTDIDLANLPWVAIGIMGVGSFYGYFDGDNHSISRMDYGLFGYAQGYIKNLTIKDTDIVLDNQMGYPFGSITAGSFYDDLLIIENCHSYANITVKDGYNSAIGGIVGECQENTYIYNSSNHGDIYANLDNNGVYLTVGGIGGAVFNTSFCYNTGDIEVKSSFVNDVKVGGIAGMASRAVKNCYNTGNVETIVYNDGTSITGGIIGYGVGNGTLLSCYNVGNIKGDTSFGLVAFVENENIFVADNCFMADSNENNGYGEAVSGDFMKSDEFVEMLNKYDGYYKKDTELVNEGYPVFDAEKIPVLDINGTMGVGEDITVANVSVYPNPANDYIKLSATSSQQSVVKIYNALGMLVDEYEMNSGEIEINVSDYNSGIYFIDLDGVMNKVVVR
ncbi:MAG: T9SS type A sorting domain-containing protein [Bacteroidales bacterium]|nr:T9SS type A sorting domain-containing protein [Bacteroidales bacterium]